MARQDPSITLDRLRRISGWSPEREPRRVWIRGDGDVAALLAVAFAGLGARHVVIHREPGRPGQSRISSRLESWLDDVEFDFRERSYGGEALELALKALDVDAFVDLAGGSQEGLRAALSAGIPTYAASIEDERFFFSLVTRCSLKSLPRSAEASTETALALAGFLTHDFANRFVLNLPEQALPPRSFEFDLRQPWSDLGERGSPEPKSLLSRPLRILLVGAGGLGCPAALALADRLPEGSRVVACDFDTVEASNRNRQLLFNSDDAQRGALKAETLCRELRAFNPKIEWIAVNEACPSPAIERHGPFDCVLSLTDSFVSRLAIDRAKIAPVLINAGVDENSAHAVLFHEGTVSMREALSLENAAAQERASASCAQAEPSIVSTNFIGASLAVSLLARHFSSGPELARMYSYESSNPQRGGAWPPFPEAQR